MKKPFEQKMAFAVGQRCERQVGAAKLDGAVAADLKEFGYGGQVG